VQSKFRLTRSEDFQRVRQSGTAYAHPLLVLLAHPSDLNQTRVGVAAGKTVGTAVRRNRAKRMIREAMRPMLRSLSAGWDLVLIARPGLDSASSADLRLALTNLLRRAKLLTSNES
jgi:ribonuclease P protein component